MLYEHKNSHMDMCVLQDLHLEPEGIYSPFTQNRRHLQLIREVKEAERGAIGGLLLRTAKRGERAGKRFYGCSRFPQCRGIVNVEG